jgi:hypothetical protein
MVCHQTTHGNEDYFIPFIHHFIPNMVGIFRMFFPDASPEALCSFGRALDDPDDIRLGGVYLRNLSEAVMMYLRSQISIEAGCTDDAARQTVQQAVDTGPACLEELLGQLRLRVAFDETACSPKLLWDESNEIMVGDVNLPAYKLKLSQMQARYDELLPGWVRGVLRGMRGSAPQPGVVDADANGKSDEVDMVEASCARRQSRGLRQNTPRVMCTASASVCCSRRLWLCASQKEITAMAG